MTRRLFFALLATLTGLFANVALPKPRRQQWPMGSPNPRIFGVVGQCGPLTLWPPPKNFAVRPAAPTEMLDSSKAVERYRRCANNEIWR